MRRWFPLLACLLLIVARVRAVDAAPPAMDPPVPPLLLDALTKLSEDFDHWAYTETRASTNPRGIAKGETIVRFDPSKPSGFPKRVMDLTLARQQIGYQPTTSLREGLQKTWDWYLANQNEHLSKVNYFRE